jgi:hypothetical protein
VSRAQACGAGREGFPASIIGVPTRIPGDIPDGPTDPEEERTAPPGYEESY